MSVDEQHDPDEKRLKALLRAVDVDAAAPDAEHLQALGALSAAAFVESASDASRADHSSSPAKLAEPARRSMHKFITLVLAPLLTSAALLLVWFNPWAVPTVSGAVPFSQVLSELREAVTLQLRVSRENETADVWVRSPGVVRWEESSTRYQIAAGSRLWKVDEATNTAEEGDSPWFRGPEQHVDLLSLLNLGVKDADALLHAQPVAKVMRDGRECLQYRVRLDGSAGAIRVEAFADAKSHELLSIEARDLDAKEGSPPVAELLLVAVDPPVDESKFVVAKTLTDDGRIGKVSDARGVVTLRPMLARRWTPISRDLLVKPGDWLRTELRGANAVKVTLASGTEVTLGPGSLMECTSPTQARLHSGFAQVNVPKQAVAAPFELLAPREGSRKFAAESKQLVRVTNEEKLVDVAQAPVWLTGFEGTSAKESIGSLIVNLPDGRNEPLYVGYHKVSVEIRDQIARTTIEESFVNHTKGRLEGVFHFPLPQDASISGFGMWIGDQLVEADIVEKQRAREIYETILRERRDPGLLEWTSGNLFKARVFPIEPESEKRIKIVYTQVLPLRNGQYRYSYSLRSDLLRTRPLNELSLNVTVNSALPLKSVRCPTHSTRLQQTEHSGQVEFNAKEYTPTRDFEVVCEVASRQADVVVVPHRRGDDGYFLLQITPPSAEGRLVRETVPDGKPLNLMLLCDTSASMDSEKRRQQSEFVASVLSSLGEDDRFNLAMADVGTEFVFGETMLATKENVAKAQAALAARISLGWTNLDRAFDDVLKRSPPEAQIVYIGDGLVSAGDTDPNSFVKRLNMLIAATKPGRAFHAVTVGNTYELTVLRGIASIGGGSVRAITGEQTPSMIAVELMNEIASPALRDMNIEFRGLKVAAVYPGRLPNVSAGAQQIVVGRYLPEGKDQQGEVVVTGKLGTETVKYVAKLNLKDAEEGNSFIPRLWARSHLDQLLQQGSNVAIRDEIISLSEQFHIITPYTSLLVLETDADRERFGVKRRYEMRDGERFFAAGKANANFELLQQQMQRAKDWRLGLRRQALRRLALLGRDPNVFRRDSRSNYWAYNSLGDSLNINGGMSSTSSPMGGGWGGGGQRPFVTSVVPVVDPSEPLGDALPELAGAKEAEYAGEQLDSESEFEEGFKLSVGEADEKKKENLEVEDREKSLADGFDGGEGVGEISPLPTNLSIYVDGDFDGLAQASKDSLYDEDFAARDSRMSRYGYNRPDYTAWLHSIFPAVASRPAKTIPVEKSDTWSPEAVALSQSLSRKETLLKVAGGIELRRTWDTFNPRWNRRDSHNQQVTLYSPTAWLERTLDADDHTLVEYANKEERGVFSLALLLGCTRAAVAEDLGTTPLSLQDYSLAPLHESHRTHIAKVEPAGENRVKLILSVKGATGEMHFLVDTARHVVVKYEYVDEGKVTTTTTYDDFVEIAGSWWAKKSVTTDDKGRKIGEIIYAIEQLAPAQFTERMNAQLAAKAQVQFLRSPLPSLAIARQKTADGSAAFEHRVVMMLYYAQLQQWDDVLKEVDAAEKLAVGKPGVRWVRTALLITMRRNEEARQRLLDESRQLAATKRQDDYYLAEFLQSQGRAVTSNAEFWELVQLLKPVYDRQPAELNAANHWLDQQRSCFDALGRQEESLALTQKLATALPWETQRHVDVARRLTQSGQRDAAIAWLKKELARAMERDDSEDQTLRGAMAETYRSQSRWQELLAFTTEWIAREPRYTLAYQEHLAALVFNDRLQAANDLVLQWLKEGRIEGKLSRPQMTRLEAAISFAQASCTHLSFNRVDQRWFEPLAETAKFFALHKHHSEIASRIYDYRFWDSDPADRLRGHYLSLLQKDMAKLTPRQANYLVSIVLGGRIELVEPIAGRKQLHAAELPLDVWKPIATALRERWQAATDKDEKHLLGETLRSIYAARFADDLLLPFLRERIANAPKEYKSGYIQSLLDTLQQRPWSAEIEQEAFATWLSLPYVADDQLMALVPSLYKLVDAMLANRIAYEEKVLTDAGGVDKLTRTELAQKKTESRKAAQTALAVRLGTEAAKQKGPLAQWLRMEQAYLDVKLDQRQGEVAAFCWEILGEMPPTLEATAEDQQITPAQAQARWFAALLRQRAYVTVSNLAARRGAPAPLVERLIKYLDAGIAKGKDTAARWRSAKFQLLVTLDRADDLERELLTWMRDDVSTSPWRVMLAKLLAERGKLAEAIALFEAAKQDKLLSAADYRALADWYLATDRKPQYEQARLETYMQMPERNLANMIYQTRNRWQRTDVPLPSELDEKTLLAFQAIFAKSSQPEAYLYYLNEIYGACRDFRLLQILPDAVLGRTPQQVYTFLQNLDSRVLHELRNEATADEIVTRIKKLREGKRTTIDLRALDLLEAMVERRSSEMLNQPGPHVEKCLAALQRAFQREWSKGEPRLMASFLYNLGTLRHKELVAEQLRQMRALQAMAPAASRDHLLMTNDLANAMFWYYGQKEEALALMETEVRAYEQAHQGQWPFADDEVLSSYVRMYEGANRHAAGEAVLRKYLAKPEHDQQRRWLQDRLWVLFNHALEHDGEVSLGKNAKLFDNMMKQWYVEIEAAADETVRNSLVERIITTFDIAHRHKLPNVAAQVEKFAFETIPAILPKQQSLYRNVASRPVEIINTTLGPKQALRYVIERVEQYPARMEISWDNAWSTFGHDLAYRRQLAADAKLDIVELEPRLLKLTIAELKRDLYARESRNHYLYHNDYSYFWTAKKEEFIKAANEVHAESVDSGRRVVYIAHYLWHGLDARARAIEILLLANGRGVLDVDAQSQLVRYLHEDQRFAESIPILEGLMKQRPDEIQYRKLLLIAYFRSQRPEQMRTLLEQTLVHFHKEGRWQEGNISELAQGCLVCQLYEPAVTYYNEAVSLHQRNHSGATMGDATLSSWYQSLASAHSSLGQTKLAVEAASAAIVCWSSRHNERQHALESLKNVLTSVKDLDAYVRDLDAEVAKSGQDSPILRKSLGLVYQNRAAHAQAIAQFKLALALQPTDKDLHKALLASYDAAGQKAEATAQLLQLIDFDRHDLTLYQQLATRLKDDEAQAERAATSIVEAAPNEAENHTAMAELRQRQERWGEAIEHWRQVSHLRRLEPTGLVKLATAQVHEKQWDGAKKTLSQLRRTEWPTRFNQLPEQVRELEKQLPQ